MNRTTRTAYTPTDGGILSKAVTTNAKNQTSTVELEPSRGLTTATVDVGSRRTTGVPATTLIQVGDSEVDDRTVTTFDGAGRATTVTAYRGVAATWDTRMVYGGDRVTTFPPRGGVTSTTVTDVRGTTSEVRQYTSAPVVSGSVVSGGAFQSTRFGYWRATASVDSR